MPTVRGEYRYVESGLAGVVLLDVELRRCPSGHERVVAIPRLSALHDVLARHVALKSGPLSGAELGLLRRYAGFESVEDFADFSGVPALTAQAMERGAFQVESWRLVEHYLRLAAVARRGGSVPSVRELKSLQDGPRRILSLRLTPTADGWRVAGPSGASTLETRGQT